VLWEQRSRAILPASKRDSSNTNVFDDDWWVYPAIVSWSFFIDATTLFAAANTFRFVFTASGIAYLTLRGAAAIVAAVVLPVVVADQLGLQNNEVLLVFFAPLVSLAILEVALGKIVQPAAPAQDFLGLIANLRAKSVQESRRASEDAMYGSALKLIDRLAGRFTSATLLDSLLNLLHTKMASLKEARARMGLLLEGLSEEEEPKRRQIATEIVKIDRVYGRNLSRVREASPKQKATPRSGSP